MSGKSTVQLTDEHIASMGKMPDAELAKIVGCTPWVVAYHRKKRGIPTFSEVHEQAGKRSLETRREWTAEEDALLGSDSDAAVAQHIGRTRASVAQRRIGLGIPSARRARGIAPRSTNTIHLSEEMRAALHELEPHVRQRYKDAGLPIVRVEPWQIVEIALTDLLASARSKRPL